MNDTEVAQTDVAQADSQGFQVLFTGRGGVWFRRFLQKIRGTSRGSPPRVSSTEVIWSWIGAFLGIGLVGLVEQWVLSGNDQVLMIGSMGASAVLVYGAPRSPLQTSTSLPLKNPPTT